MYITHVFFRKSDSSIFFLLPPSPPLPRTCPCLGESDKRQDERQIDALLCLYVRVSGPIRARRLSGLPNTAKSPSAELTPTLMHYPALLSRCARAGVNSALNHRNYRSLFYPQNTGTLGCVVIITYPG